MKGTGHLSKQISNFGRSLVNTRFKITEERASFTGYTIKLDGDMEYPCKIFTKRHDEREGLRVTGRDEQMVDSLVRISKDSKTRILILFVDAAIGACYGDFLDLLMQKKTFYGREFPIVSTTHSGSIIYWSIETMPTLFELTTEEKDTLAVLIEDNRTDKNQTRLF